MGKLGYDMTDTILPRNTHNCPPAILVLWAAHIGTVWLIINTKDRTTSKRVKIEQLWRSNEKKLVNDPNFQCCDSRWHLHARHDKPQWKLLWKYSVFVDFSAQSKCDRLSWQKKRQNPIIHAGRFRCCRPSEPKDGIAQQPSHSAAASSARSWAEPYNLTMVDSHVPQGYHFMGHHSRPCQSQKGAETGALLWD